MDVLDSTQQCDVVGHKIFSNEGQNFSSAGIPHVTECAQHIEFSWIPFGFLFLFSPILVYQLYKSPHTKLRQFAAITVRIYLCVILLIDLTASLIYNFVQWNDDAPNSALYLWGDVPQYFGACTALVFLIASRNRGLITSGVLFNYWLLCVICGLPELRFLITAKINGENIDEFRFTLFVLSYAIYVLEWFLSCFADSQKSQYLGKNECPELQSSFLNQILFEWFTPLASLGYKKALERTDLWNLNDRDKSSRLNAKFAHYFVPAQQAYVKKRREMESQNQELNAKHFPSILAPLFFCFKYRLLSSAFYKLLFDLLQFAAPQLLKTLITFIQDKNQPLWFGISIAVLMFGISLFQSMILHQYFHNMFRLGMNIRAVLTAAVYRKALLLSNNARKLRTVGEIVNLMAIDVQRMQDMTSFVMLFWSAPLQILISIYFLWRLLGVSVLVGIVILILMIPFNSWIAVKVRSYQQEQMKYKDQRLKMMSEILNGIKVLKLYAWEKSMEHMVLKIRKKELHVLKKLAFLNAVTTFSWSCAPFLVAVLTFGVYVTIDPSNNILTPQITFVALALFNILRFPLAIFAMIFGQAIQCKVSNDRLKAFFADEEMEPQQLNAKDTSDDAIRIEDGFFSWDSSENPSLTSIDLNIPRGSLVAIVGRVGSGKSNLLSAILGEMNRVNGHVDVMGNMAYVPQQAWIQNMSLRNNVLFNKQFVREFYDDVVEACALKPDLATLPAEDLTEIGEKGINLSGGQKQRISLARAVYSRADIVLLDDPLSAVDAHVGKHIFERVISSTTGMLKNTTRILVTHGLHYLKYCDNIIVMEDGKISERGTYQELMASQGAFGEFLEEYLVEEARTRGRSVSFGEDSEDVTEILQDLEKVSPDKRKRLEKQISQVHTSNEALHKPNSPTSPTKSTPTFENAVSFPLNGVQKEKEAEKESEEPHDNADEKKALLSSSATAAKVIKGKLTEKENLETGNVKMKVYLTYLRAIGYAIATMFLSVYVLSSCLGVMSNLWLARWSDDAKSIQTDDTSGSSTRWRLLVYAALGVGQSISVCGASVIMALGMVRASRLLHEGFLNNILNSPMMFFDVTPLGRLLNRFGKDVEDVDSRLPGTLQTFVGSIVQMLIVIGVTCFISLHVIWPIVLVLAYYVYFLRFYVATSRQLKRLESASRSPIYSHFQESVQGATSIRAYNVVSLFIDESAQKVDENLTTYYPSIVANRWLAVRLELVGNLIVLCAALFAVFFRNSPGLTAGLVGLSVSYALNITQTLNWAVRMTSELETNIVAVERIKEYSETPREGRNSHSTPDNADWPTAGEIVFENVCVRYREGLDYVLKNLTIKVGSNEKIGIVGRTGAGKSSLTLALFRIIELDQGKILIDGVNIADITLESLRSKLTIVPQDPVLFSGTLRINLDPFNVHSDEEIWEALQNAHLDKFVADLANKLEHEISEGGENLSVGQRQLICLARALLRKTKILILDEAAAAVDMETDSLIQKTIKEQFKNCTVLTIAHRLNTVLDSDKLLVLDHGNLAQFDSPKALLAQTDGILYGMARDAGII